MPYINCIRRLSRNLERMRKMKINQIVKGVNAGTFVILSFRNVGGEDGAQLKCVNPHDHTQTGLGELWLPLTALREIE